MDEDYEDEDDGVSPPINIKRTLIDMFRTAVINRLRISIHPVKRSVQQSLDSHDFQVRLNLIEQLPHVATICQKYPKLFGDIFRTYLLSIVIKCLGDKDNQVRMAAQTVLMTLTKKGFVSNNTIEVELRSAVDSLCNRSVDFRNFAISFMCKMAPLIGKELTEKVFVGRYIGFCDDEEISVRKTCALHFGEFCTVVGRRALFRALFPVFAYMCCDEVWDIRKACVDVMMPVSCCMTLNRRLLLAELLATHLKDESKWVRMSAFQILGPFISTLAKQFTEVSYNQHGELVFTSQQDTRFSISYSYEGIFPTKCSIRSQTFDTAEHISKDNFNSSVIIQKPIFKDSDDDESQEDHMSRMRAYKAKIQRRHLQSDRNNQTSDDTEKYNPFLYYYIAPDLPLDEELVEAAKRSTAEYEDKKLIAQITASSRALSLDDLSREEKCPIDNLEIINVSDEEEIVVPQHLIDSFLSMAEPERYSDMSIDIPHHCAFSFPAVVLTLRKENWPYLRQAYKLLASANQWKVRRTLASSIHEIAIILGEELTVSDLIPIYDGFIKDLDEVRIGVLKHLATFLKILKPVHRCQYLPRLREFLATDNESNWRFREELATQLLEIVNLFDAVDIEQYIISLALELLDDKVAAVRHVALSLVTQIVAHVDDNQRLSTELFQKLRCSFGIYAKKWISRQTFAFLCAELISNYAISEARFSREMLPYLLKLSFDKVPNVRLAVARTLSRNVIPERPGWSGVMEPEEVEKRLKEMRSDPDRDVRVLAGGEENPASDTLSQTKTEQPRNIMF